MRLQFHRSARACETRLELGDFGKVEIEDFHGGEDHLEGLFAGGADGGTEQFDIIEHLDERLIETEVADGACNLTIFNKKEAVAGHAGHDLFVGVDFADVPEAGGEEAPLLGAAPFLSSGTPPPDDQISMSFAPC